jgi:hypothetical protein
MGGEHVLALKELKKCGGEPWTTALAEFANSNVGCGRGFRLPLFDFLSYSQSIKLQSRLGKVSKGKWMTVHYYAWHALTNWGWDRERANKEWHRLREVLPKGSVSSDGEELLLPKSNTVVAAVDRVHEEASTLSHKAEKRPTPGDWSAMVGNMGKDHSRFTSDEFTRPLNLGDGALTGLVKENDFATGSGVTEQQEQARQIVEDERLRKEQLRQEKLASNRAMTFQSSAVIGALKPVWKDKAARMLVKMQELINDVGSYMQSLAPEVKDSIEDSVNTLSLRLAMLKKLRGDSNGDDAHDQQEWTQFVQSQEVVSQLEQFQEPHPELQRLQTFRQLKSSFTDGITCSTFDESLELKERLNQEHKAMSDVLAHVRQQMTRVKGLIGQRTRTETKAKAREDVQARKAAAAVLKHTARGGGGKLPHFGGKCIAP